MQQKLINVAQILFEKMGLAKTMVSHKPERIDGRPLPWYTYSAIDWFDSQIFKDLNIFEYGSGNSTKYWHAKGALIHGVENDVSWWNQNKSTYPNDVKLLLRETQEGYVFSIAEFLKKFDVIIIDGRWRFDCASIAINYLNQGGFIVFDNSDWHPESCKLLRNLNFFQIDFSGFGPINDYTWTTSVFLPFHGLTQNEYFNPRPIGGLPNNGDFKK